MSHILFFFNMFDSFYRLIDCFNWLNQSFIACTQNFFIPKGHDNNVDDNNYMVLITYVFEQWLYSKKMIDQLDK